MANKEMAVDVRIRKVRYLPDSIKRSAMMAGMSENDLVILKTTIELIKGSPIQYLQARVIETTVKQKKED